MIGDINIEKVKEKIESGYYTKNISNNNIEYIKWDLSALNFIRNSFFNIFDIIVLKDNKIGGKFMFYHRYKNIEETINYEKNIISFQGKKMEVYKISGDDFFDLLRKFNMNIEDNRIMKYTCLASL